jgi:auxin-responsive protein IAA
VKCAHRRGCGGVGSGYVKVMMQGVAIGRKVDVSLHASYEELLRTLARMFPPSAANNDGAEEDEVVAQQERARGHGHHPYVVTYENGDGDWLLVGDVPWE